MEIHHRKIGNLHLRELFRDDPARRERMTAEPAGILAQQGEGWAAKNILAEIGGGERKPFHYFDKGIMAMIGRRAAIAEMGKNHHEVHGQLAHMAWLGVHASLMTGTRDKIEAIIDWGWDRFSKTGGPHVLDRGDAAQIDWEDDSVVTASLAGTAPPDETQPTKAVT